LHHDTRSIQTFYLSHAYGPNDANFILTGLRLMLDPADKLYLDPSHNALILRAGADDMALAQKLIKEMDLPGPA